MNAPLQLFAKRLEERFGKITETQKLQTLWSDYGGIFRIYFEGEKPRTAVAKCIVLNPQNQHPRGWSSQLSHQRKIKSYEMEQNWYEHFADDLPQNVKVPQLLMADQKENMQLLVLEDFSSKYPKTLRHCSFAEAKNVVLWLAQFHAHFLNIKPDGLWPVGSYWHLATRPDEWNAMAESDLKNAAKRIDEVLSAAQFKTIIHGDAKVANFCFSNKGAVAAVDFQYVGGGVGVKDLAYFLGSCLSGDECEVFENELLDAYFNELRRNAHAFSEADKEKLEAEWRSFYPLAWADFNRFLLGWMPTHDKLTDFAMAKNEEALKTLPSFSL